MDSPALFLVDNGSLRPAATFALRSIAGALSEQVNQRVEPVSLLHSHKIPADKLNGTPATIVKRRMRELLAEGQREFVILPLFLGPSLAITDYLPTIIEELKKTDPNLCVKIAEPIAGPDVNHPEPRLVEILADHVLSKLPAGEGVSIAMVDHGTPYQPVNTLRNSVAAQLAKRLNLPVQACSMERRPGSEYAFNEPLLENLQCLEGKGDARLVLSMFFLLPGRHAGTGGDVEEIADSLVGGGEFKSVEICELLALHPLLTKILIDRYKDAQRR